MPKASPACADPSRIAEYCWMSRAYGANFGAATRRHRLEVQVAGRPRKTLALDNSRLAA